MDVAVQARSSAMRLGMVAAGMGVTIVLESIAPEVPAPVVLRRISDIHLTFDSVLSWRAADDGSVVLRSLREIAGEVARARLPSGT
jgi:DNA-binding transcriptional LysR family regulator